MKTKLKAQELRIGNYVMFYNILHDIVGITMNSITVYNSTTHLGQLTTLDSINPIPITPEWLEKLGFRKKTTIDEPIERFYVKDNVVIRYHDNKFHSYSRNPVHITHLHQLQNLYFALTGTELTLKDIK